MRRRATERVFVILNDGMHPRVTRRELAAGTMPNLAYLVAQGHAKWDAVSVFPTSTPTAVTSIVTGADPSRHRIPGMYWYDRSHRGPVYYGDNLAMIQQHFGTFFENIIGHLNHRHLSRGVATVFETLERAGKATASINSLCFRAFTPHRTTLPVFLRVLPGVRFAVDEVLGPSFMRWGDFARSGPSETRVFGEHGPFRQFGINDDCTMQAFAELVANGLQADHVMLYFPDNDVWSHQHGPEAGGPALRRFDERLGQVFDALGGRERAVTQNTFYLIADHAQVPVGCAPETVVDLDQVLSPLALLPLGEPWAGQDAFVCPNGRFAQIYLRAPDPRLRARVVELLTRDARVAQVFWREGRSFHAAGPGGRSLVFEGALGRRDRYGTGWRWQGDAILLGVERDGLRVATPAYPDAFRRVAQALSNPASGDILLTACEGYEFAGNGEEAHLGGGSHGGLLAEESYVPFVACGPGSEGVTLQDITQLRRVVLGHFGLARRGLSKAA